MNNRFKFRLWDKTSKSFVKEKVYREKFTFKEDICQFFGEYYLDLGGTVRFLNYDYLDEDLYVIVQQFTGVKDKNGKEMYEGDIVSYRFPNGSVLKGVVSFIAGMFVLDFPDQTDSGPIGFLQTLDMEIIGNIFENKDLL